MTPARLTTLSLPDACRTATHALNREVLASLLREATSYDRAVGFFSSTVFAVAPDSFKHFFESGGTLRLVCSPILGAADIGAIHRALTEPWRVAADLGAVGDLMKRAETSRALAALLVSRRILIQIAIPTASSSGIYHEKIGLFRDSHANQVAISGSANESRTAWTANFERIDLFVSWGLEDSRRRCGHIERAFEDLWRDKTHGLRVLPLQDAFLEGLLVARPPSSIVEADLPKGPELPLTIPPEVVVFPPDLKLYPHQEHAIQKWAEQRGRGILAMATGSGKTATALAIASRLALNSSRGLAILVIAPLIHLVDQWCDNAKRFGLRPIRCAESSRSWDGELSVAVNALNSQQRALLSVAVTQSTMVESSRFRDLIARIRAPLLVIGDEVHNYGSPQASGVLPSNANFRLGLSATPERYRDEAGTKRITDYFGPVAFRYGLAQAIREEILAPYRYFPVRVNLEVDELEEYVAVSHQLARYGVLGEDDQPSEVAKRLLIRRARIVASARLKLTHLERLLSDKRSESHILVYCGDGQVQGPVPDEQQRQVEAAVSIIGSRLKMACASYTAKTPPEKRRVLLEMFASGDIQVLVAIRCLDEGVDVPSTRTAIMLASSSNPRQYVQRRGRVLRRAPGKSRADIYDFIVCPDLSELQDGSPELRFARSLLTTEFRRAAQFAATALNGPVARQSLLDITERLALFDEWYTPSPEEEELS